VDQEAQELLVIGDQEKVRTIVAESYVVCFFFFLRFEHFIKLGYLGILKSFSFFL
jgi:hypothetical protein